MLLIETLFWLLLTIMLVRSASMRAALTMSGRAYTSVVNTASRGIGLEFTRQLLAKPETTQVFALCRSINPSPGLVELQEQFGSKLVSITGVDLEDVSSIHTAVTRISQQAENGVDLLINCAGILGDNSPSMPGPERSILKIDPVWLKKTFDVNFFSHVLMTQGIAPLMKRKKSKNDVWFISSSAGRVE